jgi:hypothetical protein
VRHNWLWFDERFTPEEGPDSAWADQKPVSGQILHSVPQSFAYRVDVRIDNTASRRPVPLPPDNSHYSTTDSAKQYKSRDRTGRALRRLREEKTA